MIVMPAVTPRLFVDDCPFPHIVTEQPETAALAIQQGETVCVQEPSVAVEVLKILGLSDAEAHERVFSHS